MKEMRLTMCADLTGPHPEAPALGYRYLLLIVAVDKEKRKLPFCRGLKTKRGAEEQGGSRKNGGKREEEARRYEERNRILEEKNQLFGKYLQAKQSSEPPPSAITICKAGAIFAKALKLASLEQIITAKGEAG